MIAVLAVWGGFGMIGCGGMVALARWMDSRGWGDED